MNEPQSQGQHRTALALALAVTVLGLGAVAYVFLLPHDQRGPSAAPGAAGAAPAGVEHVEATDPQETARLVAESRKAEERTAPRRQLSEAEFIELSSSILIGVAQIQDRPEVQELIPPLMDKVLREAGVAWEDFEAFAQQVYADPKRSSRVADAILKRVEERTTPKVRMRVVSLAEVMRQRLQRKAAEKSAQP